MNRGWHRRHHVLPFCCLCIALGIEFVLFDRFGARRVTCTYPRWNDQIQYLSDAYLTFEHARQVGFRAALWHALISPSAQGPLHGCAALILFEIAGPSRSAALALNLLALELWQVALFGAAWRAGARPWITLAIALLPLGLQGPWLILPGSAYDFRLDHLAMCLMGAATCVAAMTEGFRLRVASIGFGAAAAIAILARFLTGTYFALVFVGFAGLLLTQSHRRRRLGGFALAAATTASIAGPLLWLNREWVWNYYYIGHYIGPESAIRNQHFGLLQSVDFVAHWAATRHIGAPFFLLAAAVAAGLAALRTRYPAPLATDGEPRSAPNALIWSGVIFILSPAVVLVLHAQKSDVVLSALSPGVVLLTAGAWIALESGISRARQATIACSALCLCGGAALLLSFGTAQLRKGDDAATTANLRQVNGIADFIFDRVKQAQLARPRVSVDYITDAFDAQVLRVVCYERHHLWIDFDMRLPTGIAAPEEGIVLERLQESDFVFLNTGNEPFGSFPYDQALLRMRPRLRQWCDAHLRPELRFSFWGHPMTLYGRGGANEEMPDKAPF